MFSESRFSLKGGMDSGYGVPGRAKNEIIFIRKYESNYWDLDYKHLKDIARETGCIKPCKYKKYRLDWDREPMVKTFRTTEGFGLLATSNYTTVGIIISTAGRCS